MNPSPAATYKRTGMLLLHQLLSTNGITSKLGRQELVAFFRPRLIQERALEDIERLIIATHTECLLYARHRSKPLLCISSLNPQKHSTW